MSRHMVTALAGVMALVGALPVRAQAVLHPNQIVGGIHWSNTNATVRDIIDARDTYSWFVTARHPTPPPELTATTNGTTTRGAEVDRYELTVETSPAGIPYSVKAQASAFGDWWYRFAARESAPVVVEPAPDVTVDFIECAGLVRVRLPGGVTGGRIVAWRDGEGTFGDEDAAQAIRDVDAGETLPWILVHGDGHDYSIRVRFTYGTDPRLDLLIFETVLHLAVGCDAVVDEDCSGGGSGGGPPDLGTVLGAFDVVGEREIPDVRAGVAVRTVVLAGDGPWGNGRTAVLPGDPSSGSFTLPNVMPSDVVSPPRPYDVEARAWLRAGWYLQDYTSPSIPVEVPAGTTVDVGSALVLDPAWLEGDIQFAGPPRSGSFGSALDHVRLSGNADPSWLPPDGSLANSRIAALSGESAFPAVADPVSAELLGDYEAVVTRLGPGPWSLNAGMILLDFYHRLSPADPLDDIDSTVQVFEYDDVLTASPGDHLVYDRRYCVSQVNLDFLATSGVFCCPWLSTRDGGFVGRDFLGRDVDYAVTVEAGGTPLEIDAGPTGRVTMAMPQGHYTLCPSFRARNPVDGRWSSTQVLPIPLTVGCRQVIDLYPELGLQIGVDDVPPCAEAGLVHVSGSVRSVDAVARVEWRVQGGANGVICTDCGVSPTFEADVPLEDRDNDIVFTATDVVGRTASVNAFSQWAPEPSALDRRPGSQPLLVAKDDAGGLVITLESRAPSNVYRGTIDSLHRGRAYDHRGIGACDVSSGRLVLAAESGSVYFVASGTCAWGDGSVGRDSFGRERPPAIDRCP